MSHPFPPAAIEEIHELRSYLTQTNPYFALWILFKRRVVADLPAIEWRKFLLGQFGPECEEEIEFACAMVELDKLLAIYSNQSLALPMLLFERICFLHCIRGAERMSQTRAVLGTLTAELPACTSV